MNKFFALIIVSFVALGIYLWVACSSDSIRIVDNNNADDDNVEQSSEIDADDDSEEDLDSGNDDSITPDDDLSTGVDYPSVTEYIEIIYNGNDVSVHNPYSPDVEITYSGAHVVVNGMVTDMVCKISGSSSNGSLKVYGTEPFTLALQGVELTNPTSSAINIQSHKRVDLLIEDETINKLADGGIYEIVTGEDAKGALFAEGQIIVSGTGTLQVQSYNAHAIASDNYIKIESGNIVVTEASQDAIHSNTGLVLNNGLLDLKATDDAIQVDEGIVTINNGSILASTGDDGIVSAYEGSDVSITSGIEIYDGSFTINTTGDKGMAIKSTSNIVIKGGDFVLDTKGKGAKGISCDGNCNISGGNFDIMTSGGVYYISSSDKSTAAGIKCDGNLTIAGGVMDINSSGAGGKGINVDGVAIVSDGVITIKTSGSEQYSSKAKAFKSDGDMIINGGTITIKTQKDGAEGLESKTTFTINGGEVYVKSYDDALNAEKKVIFNEGKIYLYSSNNDAVDCNNSSSGSISINGGLVVACSNAGAPEGALDSDHGTLAVSGGSLITMGAEHSVPTNSTAKQNTILFSNIAVSEGEYLAVYDADNRVIIALNVPCNRFSRGSNSTMVTSPDIESGKSYSIGILENEPTEYSEAWRDVYLNGDGVPVSTLSTMTVSSTYTGASSSGGPGGGPGGGGFRPW